MPNALVTGASTGIGQATAVSLARAGHKVYAAMRNPQTGGNEIRAIAEREKLAVTLIQLDVDSDESVARCFAAAGPLDVLVNNAGIAMHGSVEELPVAGFKRVMETNFFGVIRCIQAVVGGMRERRSGLIVNVSSVVGRFSSAPQAPYTSSKWALEAMSEALAQEVRPFGVRVAIVEPGLIATPIFGKSEFEKESIYPHARRLNAFFAASLKNNPVSPYVVGDVIRDIVAGDSWKLRYPAGPDAADLIAWRQSVSDEEWIAGNAVSDEEWLAIMKKMSGLDIKL